MSSMGIHCNSSWAKKKVCVTRVERARGEQWKMSAETQETPSCRAGQPEGAPWRYLTWSHWGTFSESKSEVAQSCLTLCNPINYCPPSIHGIFQARVLEWVAISFSRGSCQPRDWTRSPALQANTLPSEPPGKHLQQRSTKVGQGFYSRHHVANRLNGSKDGSKSAREETPDTIRMINYDSSNQGGSREFECHTDFEDRIDKIYWGEEESRMILMCFGLSKRKGRMAAKMGKSVEGVGLNKLILSNLLDNWDISCWSELHFFLIKISIVKMPHTF